MSLSSEYIKPELEHFGAWLDKTMEEVASQEARHLAGYVVRIAQGCSQACTSREYKSKPSVDRAMSQAMEGPMGQEVRSSRLNFTFVRHVGSCTRLEIADVRRESEVAIKLDADSVDVKFNSLKLTLGLHEGGGSRGLFLSERSEEKNTLWLPGGSHTTDEVIHDQCTFLNDTAPVDGFLLRMQKQIAGGLPVTLS